MYSISLLITCTSRCNWTEWSVTPTVLASCGGGAEENGREVVPSWGQCRYRLEIRPRLQIAWLKLWSVSAWSAVHTAHTREGKNKAAYFFFFFRALKNISALILRKTDRVFFFFFKKCSMVYHHSSQIHHLTPFPPFMPGIYHSFIPIIHLYLHPRFPSVYTNGLLSVIAKVLMSFLHLYLWFATMYIDDLYLFTIHNLCREMLHLHLYQWFLLLVYVSGLF